ncbi:hypothetical protein TSUD_337840 [Trifolium subterraneum]|uniref:Uncharacterized protein n=1 Tax=Trifolium subterraneum TaxID=3900 RepID=A0A2Z6M5I6_TRISU|nr:hypothetical protein TSUD_337840 [Trifolium subterraneum]
MLVGWEWLPDIIGLEVVPVILGSGYKDIKEDENDIGVAFKGKGEINMHCHMEET